jgi:hypothetical protein
MSTPDGLPRVWYRDIGATAMGTPEMTSLTTE